MKNIILIAAFAAFLFFFVVLDVTNYRGRMIEYNRHVCAVYGYKEDCKTPLNGRR